MPTFNKASAPTSRKYVAEQGIVMSNWSKTFQHCCELFVATFNETHASTSRKDVAEKGIGMLIFFFFFYFILVYNMQYIKYKY